MEHREPHGFDAWTKATTNPDGSLGAIVDGDYPEIYQIFTKWKTQLDFNSVYHNTTANLGDADQYLAVAKSQSGSIWAERHYEDEYNENTITYTGGGSLVRRTELNFFWYGTTPGFEYLRELTIETFTYDSDLDFTKVREWTKYDYTGAVIDSSTTTTTQDIMSIGLGWSHPVDNTVTRSNTEYKSAYTTATPSSSNITAGGTFSYTDTKSEPAANQWRAVIPHDFDPPPLPSGAPDPPLESQDQRWHGTWHNVEVCEVMTPEDHDPLDPASPQKQETASNEEWTGPGLLINYDGFDLLTDEQKETRRESWKSDWVDVGWAQEEGAVDVLLKRSQCYHGAPWVYH